MGVSLSVIKLRKMKATAPGEFKIPFGYTVPILSAGIILYFLSNLSDLEMRGTLIFEAVLSLIYFLLKYLQKKKPNEND
jgi:amino acid transporter